MKLLILLFILVGCDKANEVHDHITRDCYQVNYYVKACKTVTNGNATCTIEDGYGSKPLNCRYYDIYRGNE